MKSLDPNRSPFFVLISIVVLLLASIVYFVFLLLLNLIFNTTYIWNSNISVQEFVPLSFRGKQDIIILPVNQEEIFLFYFLHFCLFLTFIGQSVCLSIHIFFLDAFSFILFSYSLFPFPTFPDLKSLTKNSKFGAPLV